MLELNGTIKKLVKRFHLFYKSAFEFGGGVFNLENSFFALTSR